VANLAQQSIVLNASGGPIGATGQGATGATGQGGFYVSPVRQGGLSANLNYNTATYEITIASSSIKYKKNVIDLNRNTANIYDIRAREYDWKTTNEHFIGYIVEELNEIDPLFTWKNKGEPEGVEWTNITMYMLEEMKKLKNKIIKLEIKKELKRIKKLI
jgi:hypothetical protein